MTQSSERRMRSRRFPLSVPVEFSWLGPDRSWKAGHGTTRDVSIHGIFIFTYAVPIPGSTIEVSVQLPSLMTSGAQMKLVGSGTVLRVDPPDSQATGFAAEVRFCAQGDGVSSGSASEDETH
jgi:hypothetical protein